MHRADIERLAQYFRPGPRKADYVGFVNGEIEIRIGRRTMLVKLNRQQMLQLVNDLINYWARP